MRMWKIYTHDLLQRQCFSTWLLSDKFHIPMEMEYCQFLEFEYTQLCSRLHDFKRFTSKGKKMDAWKGCCMQSIFKLLFFSHLNCVIILVSQGMWRCSKRRMLMGVYLPWGWAWMNKCPCLVIWDMHLYSIF